MLVLIINVVGFHRVVAAGEAAGELSLLLLLAVERPVRRESGAESLIEAATEGSKRIKMPPAPTKTSETMLREKRTSAKMMATERMTEPGEDLRATKVAKISGQVALPL